MDLPFKKRTGCGLKRNIIRRRRGWVGKLALKQSQQCILGLTYQKFLDPPLDGFFFRYPKASNKKVRQSSPALCCLFALSITHSLSNVLVHNCIAKQNWGACDIQGLLLIGSQLLDGDRSHDWQILAT